MIMVDIQVPMLDRVYDFELDEEKKTQELVEEIVSLVEERERLQPFEKKEMYLYALRQECVLRRNEGLAVQNVKNGDRLILI